MPTNLPVNYVSDETDINLSVLSGRITWVSEPQMWRNPDTNSVVTYFTILLLNRRRDRRGNIQSSVYRTTIWGVSPAQAAQLHVAAKIQVTGALKNYWVPKDDLAIARAALRHAMPQQNWDIALQSMKELSVQADTGTNLQFLEPPNSEFLRLSQLLPLLQQLGLQDVTTVAELQAAVNIARTRPPETEEQPVPD